MSAVPSSRLRLTMSSERLAAKHAVVLIEHDIDRVLAISDDNPPVNDPKYGRAARSLSQAVAGWRGAGVDLVIATPWETRRYDRSDFADVILAHGVEAVRSYLEQVWGEAAARLKLTAEN